MLPARLTEPMGKEARLYRRLPSGRVQCTACARLCQIGEGQIGLCGVRGVVNGKLYLLVYGKVIAGHIDPIEKKPVVHYRPGSKIFSIATTGCNWLCHPAGTKIMLSDGRKEDVERLSVGDSVWSYDTENEMRIRPNIVTHVGQREARIWEIRYSKGGRVFLTEEHPVYTTSGWKAAGELKEGDHILEVRHHGTGPRRRGAAPSVSRAVFHCRSCGEEVVGLPEWNRHRGKCYARGPEGPAVARYGLRTEGKNRMRDPEAARRALASGRARFPADQGHVWHGSISTPRSPPHGRPSEGMLYRLLDESGVRYEKGYGIVPERRMPGSKDHYPADAAVPELKLAIEVDGRWHSSDVKEQDRTLDLNGWRVIRVPESYLFDHPEEVKALILENVETPVLTNRRQWVVVSGVGETDRFEKVYSFECIPDHSYVADGVLVHNCGYCQNYDISQRRKVEGEEHEPQDIVSLAASRGCEGIAYTYNQPTIFIEYASDVGRLAREKGLFNIFVSNGYDTPETVGAMKDFLDCITVDFKGSGETGFVRRYIGIPDAQPIFNTLLELRDRTKVHIEITDLIVPQIGDDLGEAKKLSSWVYDNLGPDTPVHFLRFHPDYKLMNLPATPVETLERHYEVAREAGLRYVYIGNVPGHPAESTYCPGCGKVLVKRHGYYILKYDLDRKNRCNSCGYKTPVVGPLSRSAGEDRFIPVMG